MERSFIYVHRQERTDGAAVKRGEREAAVTKGER
jgi:hypothetical protein